MLSPLFSLEKSGEEKRRRGKGAGETCVKLVFLSPAVSVLTPSNNDHAFYIFFPNFISKICLASR